MVEKEEDDLKVARHVMDFKVKDSNAGEAGEDKTDTRTTEVELELEPPKDSTPVRSYSKSRSQRATSQQAEPSTARDGAPWETIASVRGFPDDPFWALREDI